MKLWMFFVLSLLINFTEITFFADVLANEDTGMIQGKVSLSTSAPALPQIVVDKTIDFCGATLTDPILMVQEGGVERAVVSLEWQGEFHTIAEPGPPISLKSQNCLFSPRIQATRVGTYLHLNSGDETAHNPHGWWNNTKNGV